VVVSSRWTYNGVYRCACPRLRVVVVRAPHVRELADALRQLMPLDARLQQIHVRQLHRGSDVLVDGKPRTGAHAVFTKRWCPPSNIQHLARTNTDNYELLLTAEGRAAVRLRHVKTE